MVSDPSIAIFLIAFGALGIAAEFCLPGKVIPGVVGGVLVTVGAASLIRTPQPIPVTLALKVWLPTSFILVWLSRIALRARRNKRAIASTP
jgi:membrane-bound ClpP family serine protease